MRWPHLRGIGSVPQNDFNSFVNSSRLQSTHIHGCRATFLFFIVIFHCPFLSSASVVGEVMLEWVTYPWDPWDWYINCMNGVFVWYMWVNVPHMASEKSLSFHIAFFRPSYIQSLHSTILKQSSKFQRHFRAICAGQVKPCKSSTYEIGLLLEASCWLVLERLPNLE